MDINHIFANPRGVIEAPAGTGKTYTIVQALKIPSEKPYLILTHTTAGVAALKKRLDNEGVPGKQYKLTTIAAWAIGAVKKFPAMSGYRIDNNSPLNYVAIQNAATNLVAGGHITQILQASYQWLFVDEYQDCSISQHSLVEALAAILPSTLFGDPMQAIFGFGNDRLPSWENQVLNSFPRIGTLDTPWRWDLAGCSELGHWLLAIRQELANGNQIDISNARPEISWYQLTGNAATDQDNQLRVLYQLYSSIDPEESVLVIGDSRQEVIRHNFAKRANGLGVVEPVDLRDICNHFRSLEGATGEALLEEVTALASKVMTGLNRSQLLRRAATINGGRNRNEPTIIELAAVGVIQEGTPARILEFIEVAETMSETKVFRHSALKITKEALTQASSGASVSLSDSVASARERRRHAGDRRVPHKAIGSTLLLKGLEADHVVILDATPGASGMDAKNLYVALSRGAKTITVFSRSPIIG